MKKTIRTMARALLPPMLQSDEGEGVVYTLSLIKDAAIEWLIQGVNARHPLVAGETALPLIGKDRIILRGPDEPVASYRVRLARWLDSHRRRGHGFAVAEQIAGYLEPHDVVVKVVTNTGIWYQRDADGTETVTQSTPDNWDWDGGTAWWRFWVIIHMDPVTNLPYRSTPTWGSADLWEGKWGDAGHVWGSDDLTAADVFALRTLANFWSPAIDAEALQYIIISHDPADFDPAAGPGLPLPDGTWANSSKGTAPRTHSRNTNASYIPGSAPFGQTISFTSGFDGGFA